MHITFRIIQRILVAVLVLGSVWFLITHVWREYENSWSMFAAIFITYILVAYIILPRIIHVTIFAIRGARIPKFTRAADGLLADPVNIVLAGSKEQLEQAFLKAGWHIADKRSVLSSIKMGIAFTTNKKYPTAPFSALYLFGRKQDIGFEQAIDISGQPNIQASPRRRHHIRLWAVNIDEHDIEEWHNNPEKIKQEPEFLDFRFWNKKHEVDYTKPIVWVGAGTKDIGFGFAKLTYQISHAIDTHVDEERDYILKSLEQAQAINNYQVYASGAYKIGKYTSDGNIALAKLL